MPAKRIGEGIGYYRIATSGGTSFAPMITLAILQLVSYKAYFLTSAALAIVTLFLILLSKKHEKEVTTNDTIESSEKSSFVEYAFDIKALLPCIIVLCFSFTLGGVTSFLKPLGKEAGIQAAISLFFLVEAIVLLVSKAVSGIMYDRLGHKIIMYPAAVCGMIRLYLLSIVNSTSVLLVAEVFYGASYAFLTPTLQTIAVSKVDKKNKGQQIQYIYLSWILVWH